MMTSPKKPNILFIQTDQQRHDAMACADSKYITPHLDSIVASGIRFSDAVCNIPMCVASRYSMMTGLYGFQNGVKHNTQMIANDTDMPVPVLAEHLKSAGYQTAGFGKTHWYIGSGILPDIDAKCSTRGFETRYIRGTGEDQNNHEEGAIYMGDLKPEWVQKDISENSQFGPGGETREGYIGIESKIDADEHAESWLTQQSLNFLENDLDSEKPFFLYLSLDFPHVGFRVPKGYEELYDIDDFSDKNPDDTESEGHRIGEHSKDAWLEMTPKERQRSRLRYAALCTYVDDLYGKVLQKLTDLNELENTFIVFTSDHGDMMGDRGTVSKYSLYEGSIRVPLIIAGPGVTNKGLTDHRPAELVDVVPTILDAIGEEIPNQLPGLSLLSDSIRTASFAEMHGRGYEQYQRAPAIMYRSKNWKLILYISGPLGLIKNNYENIQGELYHLKQDPIELNNLYKDDNHCNIREKMKTQLLLHIMCSLGRFPSGEQRALIDVTGPETKPPISTWS